MPFLFWITKAKYTHSEYAKHTIFFPSTILSRKLVYVTSQPRYIFSPVRHLSLYYTCVFPTPLNWSEDSGNEFLHIFSHEKPQFNLCFELTC